MHDRRYREIVDAGWATLEPFDRARATHRRGDALRHLVDAAYQELAVLLAKGAHGPLQDCLFGNDIEG